MCIKFEVLGQSILTAIQDFHTVRIVLYIWCSVPVVQELNGPQREKTSLQLFANNKGADQLVYLRSLISDFVIHLLESTISKLASASSEHSIV